MEKAASRSLEMLVFVAALLLPGALLVYAWFVLAPPSMTGAEFKPMVAAVAPDTAGLDVPYVGAKIALWSEADEQPWLVIKPKVALPPVDLPLPMPSVPKPPTPLPSPGPRLEHAGNLPRWGTFPAKTEAPPDAE